MTSQNPSQVGMDFERLINFVASCDKVSQKSLAKLARLFYNYFRPSWAEVNDKIIPNLGKIFRQQLSDNMIMTGENLFLIVHLRVFPINSKLIVATVYRNAVYCKCWFGYS